MAKIGYSKIGRSWNLNPEKATSIGGDIDVINLLKRLSLRFPEHEFVLVGKNSGENPADFGYASNITNPWTQWKKDWKIPEDPRNSDLAVEQFRRISGDIHKELDGMIVWAGQHGSANSRIPMIGSDWSTPPGWEMTDYDVSRGEEWGNAHNDIITRGDGPALATPQFCFIHYCSWLLDLISRWREAGPGPLHREEIWLCPDPRNYLKCRELRWPQRKAIISQYDFVKYQKHERYGRFPKELMKLDPDGFKDKSQWVSNRQYVYGGLELTAVGSPEEIEFDPTMGHNKFGMVINENLQNVKDNRLDLLKTWIFPNFPDAEIRGHWTDKSQLDMKRIIVPVPYPEAYKTMKTFATTLTTPASGSEWATAKPWEAFALGSVCFFHPRYDKQGHILPNKETYDLSIDEEFLAFYLRVDSAEMLKERVKEVTSKPEFFDKIVRLQRQHFEKSFATWQGGTRAIGDRIMQGLGETVEELPWTVYTSPGPPTIKQTRAEPIPRGKRKAPISRRRALTQEMIDAGVETLDEPLIPEAVSKEANITQEEADMAVKKYVEVKENDWIGIIPGSTVKVKCTPIGNVSKVSYGNAGWSSGVKLSTVFTSTPTRTGRPTRDEHFINIAFETARRSTCVRRSVGCVLVDKKGRVLATGYNGVPAGFAHCNEGNLCPGANELSGQGLDKCRSAHAEINALLQCRDVDEIETVYLTVSPCGECIKALLNTGATRIVFGEEYVHPISKELWLSRAGNAWLKVERKNV